MSRYALGHGFTEYSLSIALVAVVAGLGLVALGGSLKESFGAMFGAPGTQQSNQSTLNAQQRLQNAQLNTRGPAGRNTFQEDSGQDGGDTQVSGINGDAAITVEQNANQLLSLASQQQTISPELANLLRMLGSKGLELSSVMQPRISGKGGKQADPTNKKGEPVMQETVVLPSAEEIQVPLHDFSSIWAQVESSPEYQALTPEEQALVRKLVGENVMLGENAMTETSVVSDSTVRSARREARIVKKNSNQILDCSNNVCTTESQ
jgi:hypothetical protein